MNNKPCENFLIDRMSEDLNCVNSFINNQMVLTSDILGKSNNVLLQVDANKHLKSSKINENAERCSIEIESFKIFSRIVEIYENILNDSQLTSNNHQNTNFLAHRIPLRQRTEYLLTAMRKINAMEDNIKKIEKESNDIEMENLQDNV